MLFTPRECCLKCKYSEFTVFHSSPKIILYQTITQNSPINDNSSSYYSHINNLDTSWEDYIQSSSCNLKKLENAIGTTLFGLKMHSLKNLLIHKSTVT